MIEAAETRYPEVSHDVQAINPVALAARSGVL
jgi:hypothetical protein